MKIDNTCIWKIWQIDLEIRQINILVLYARIWEKQYFDNQKVQVADEIQRDICTYPV